MKYIFSFLCLLISTSAFADQASWEYYGKKALQDNLPPMHIIGTQNGSDALYLVLWDNGVPYFMMNYENTGSSELTPDQVTFHIRQKSNATGGSDQSVRLNSADTRVFKNRAPGSNKYRILILLSASDFKAVGESRGIELKIKPAGQSVSVHSFTSEGFENEAFLASFNFKMENYEDIEKAEDAKYANNVRELKKTIGAFRFTEPQCGRPEKIASNASDTSIDRANRLNRDWSSCIHRVSDDDINKFKLLVKDIGGTITPQGNEGRFKYRAPRKFSEVDEDLEVLYVDIVQRRESRYRVIGQLNDYVDDVNQRRDDDDARRAQNRHLNQAKQRQVDEFWTSMSDALERGQREIDQMNAQRQQYLNNQIYVTPGYK